MPQMFSAPTFFRREPPPSPASVTQRPISTELSPDSVGKNLPHIETHFLEDDKKREKARKAAKYLKLIVHCQRCNGKCNTVICKNTRLLLNHCAPCQKREKCPIKGCFQTKKLLCHMIACRFERKQAKEAGIEPKYCSICSAVENSSDDDQPQENTSPQTSLDMDGFTRPTMLPRRFRAGTQENSDLSGGNNFSSNYNCRSFSVEEESEEMEEDSGSMEDSFRNSRRSSI